MKQTSLFFIALVSMIFTSTGRAQEKPVPNGKQAQSVNQVKQKSLFQRLGGLAGMQAITTGLANHVNADDRINKKFSKSNVERISFYFVQDLCAVTGGPCEYGGLDMKKAHENMGVTNGEFKAIIEAFAATLDDLKISGADQEEFLSMLTPLQPVVVEVTSDETNTPLPSNFKPAPPLDKQTRESGPVNRKKSSKRSKLQFEKNRIKKSGIEELTLN